MRRDLAAKVGAAIAAGLEKLMGARVDVMVRTHDESVAGDRRQSLCGGGGSGWSAGFTWRFSPGLAAEGVKAAFEAIASQNIPRRRDRFHVAGEHIYFHFPEGAGETKFSGRERWIRRSGLRGRAGTGTRC